MTPREPLYLPVIRIPLLLFVLSIIAFDFPGVRDAIDAPFSGIETQNLTVRSINRESPKRNTAVRTGDRIIAVNGTRVRNYHHLRDIIGQNRSFASQAYTLERKGTTLTVDISYAPVPASLVYRRFASLLVSFTFLLMAVLVLLRRSDPVGVLFSLNCAMLAFLLSDRPIVSPPFLQISAELTYDLIILMFPAVFMHFFLVFPERPPGQPLSRHRVIGIYSPAAIVFVVSAIVSIRNFRLSASSPALEQAILAISTLYLAIYLITSLGVFVRRYRRSSVAQKEKLHIAIAGTMAGILPFLIMTVWHQIAPGGQTVFDFVSILSLAFVSVSFAYAILKHGALDLNIVVRRSLAYAFLTGLVITAYYGLVNLLGDFLMSEFNLRPAYFSTVSVLVLAVVFAPAREIVQRAVDHLFFRGEYDYKHEVVEFNRELAKKIKKDDIFRYFSGRMHSLLGTSYIAFYAIGPKAKTWELAHLDGDPVELPVEFPRESLLGRYLTRYKRPLMVEYLEYSWGRRHLDHTSTDFLGRSGASVCLPVGASEGLLGLVVLGPKRSGVVYSRTDQALLERCGEHLGLVLDNAELHEATIAQERLRNELALASEIQQSVLPTKAPKHQGLDVVGKMVSSVEVGGDCFDYFSLDENRVGLAIGDVQGKGVPAAILMSSLQAVFKNIAVKDKLGPADMVRELNRHLTDNGKPDQFATFFYGILNVATATFTYCNAGHCPAFLARDSYVDRLGEGGPILGVDRDSPYTDGTVRVDPGDRLILYTDGLTEQASPSGEFFGDERLASFFQVNPNLPPERLLDDLFATVLAFGDGAQDDDMTCIIARHGGT